MPLLSLLAAGGVSFFWPISVICFQNDRGTASAHPIGSAGTFSVTYHHSLYDQPVTEEFAVAPDGSLTLTRIVSRSGAVLEYFGFPDGRESRPMARPLRALVFRVAMGEPQVLEIGGRRISFLALGEPGDRITAKPVSVALGTYLIESTRQHLLGN